MSERVVAHWYSTLDAAQVVAQVRWMIRCARPWPKDSDQSGPLKCGPLPRAATIETALCDNSGKVRPEFEIDDVFIHVMFVYRVVLHPEILPHAKAILDAAVDLLGQDALIVMWRGLGNIPDADLAEIGFRKIAGTELICRQSTLRSRFSEKYPRGQDVDVVGRPEFEQWVLEQWQKEELD